MQELSFWTKLADEPLWLKVRWPYTFDLFDHYLITPAEADVQEYRALMQEQGLDPEQPFQADDADLARVRSYNEEENPDGFPDAYIESLALYQNITELLLARDVMQFHCSALEMDGRAYLFTAPSGTGKSTHVRLWRQVFGARVTVINDDKPLVRLQKMEAGGSMARLMGASTICKPIPAKRCAALSCWNEVQKTKLSV